MAPELDSAPLEGPLVLADAEAEDADADAPDALELTPALLPGPSLALALALTLGPALALAEGSALALTLALADGSTLALALAEGSTLALAEGSTEAEAEGEAEGSTAEEGATLDCAAEDSGAAEEAEGSVVVWECARYGLPGMRGPHNQLHEIE